MASFADGDDVSVMLAGIAVWVMVFNGRFGTDAPQSFRAGKFAAKNCFTNRNPGPPLLPQNRIDLPRRVIPWNFGIGGTLQGPADFPEDRIGCVSLAESGRPFCFERRVSFGRTNALPAPPSNSLAVLFELVARFGRPAFETGGMFHPVFLQTA